MKLPARNLNLKPLVIKDKSVLALDTGVEADSPEGLRLVKASRGSGWFYHAGVLSPWTTRGVLQEQGKLVVWGDLDRLPPGSTPEFWPQTGEEGRQFLKALVLAWTTRVGSDEPLAPFSPSAVIPFSTSEGWAFAFPPPELRGVLDSLQPLADRLAWEHFIYPEAMSLPSWAFASAALAWDLVAGTVPWAQEDETHLRQEIRELKKTLSIDELPDGPDAETLRLWFDSLTGRLGTPAAVRWKTWAASGPSWQNAPDPTKSQRRLAAEQKRLRRRAGASFWRRKGTLTVAVGTGVLVVLAVIGSAIWGAVKPDPTDVWTPLQVVKGYYEAMSVLDSDLMHKLTSFDASKQPELNRDQTEASNLYVIRQVRTGYERKSPVLEAQFWEDQGRPALTLGQILYGVAGLEVSGQETSWVVHYRKWTSDVEEGSAPYSIGSQVVDQLTLSKTPRGWKISGLQRLRQPLP